MVAVSVYGYYNYHSEAPVAQLDRASVYGTEGWGSESLQA